MIISQWNPEFGWIGYTIRINQGLFKIYVYALIEPVLCHREFQGTSLERLTTSVNVLGKQRNPFLLQPHSTKLRAGQSAMLLNWICLKKQTFVTNPSINSGQVLLNHLCWVCWSTCSELVELWNHHLLTDSSGWTGFHVLIPNSATLRSARGWNMNFRCPSFNSDPVWMIADHNFFIL